MSSGATGEAMLCRITQSHWKEGEMVPTYFVSQKPRKGYFQRLKDALQQAPMYSRIEIAGGGVFREKIVIDKPVEIGVAKASDAPTILNKGTGVVFQVDEALLENVRVEAEDSTTPCVTVIRGSPIIRWCTLQAVEVSGTASPTIEECKLLDSKTHGLYLTDRATGTYTKNSIWGHSGYSVQIESRAEPTVSYNVIAASDLGQVSIQDDPEDPGRVAPYLLLNRISDDRDMSKDIAGTSGGAPGGVSGPADAFSQGAAPSSSNTVNENGVLPAHKLDALPVKRVGMKVAILPSQHLNTYSADFDEETSDDPALMDNVTGQRSAVLVSGSHAQPTLVRNTIASCKHHGITVKSGASGVYETNYISANKGWGILVQGETTAPQFKANHVGSNGGGARVLGSPASFTNNNSLFGNRGPQLVVHDGHDRFLCEGNTFKSGNRTGVLCTGSGAGTFRRNHFDGCAIAVRVESLADPTFERDSFEQCRIGVYVREGGLGTFVACHITDIILYGALIMSLGNPVFQGCQFVFNETGAVVMRRGRGTFEGCCFRDCRECGIDVSTESHPIVSHCEVRACQQGGVRVHQGGRGEFTQNLLVRNHHVQMHVSEGGDPLVTANVLGFTEADGVCVVSGGRGTFVQNIIQSCYQSGVVVAGGTTSPVIRANQIADCGMSGLQLTDGRLGTYEKNTITRCCRACVSIEGFAIDAQDSQEAVPSTQAATTITSSSTAAAQSTQGPSATAEPHLEANAVPSAAGRDARYVPVVLRSNFLYHTNCCGVIAERRAAVLIHKCVFRYHQQGIVVRGASDVVLVENVLRDCTHGVSADEESALQLFKNVMCAIRGTGVASLSTCVFQARGNTFTDCGTSLLLRRTGRGVCMENTIRQSHLYGIFLGSDCRCVVKRNVLYDNRVGISFSELHNRAEVMDNCILNASEQGIRVAGDAMDAACCRLNVVLSSKVGLFVRLGCLKVECNLFLNCEEGIRVNAVPGKNAALTGAGHGPASLNDTLAATGASGKRTLGKANASTHNATGNANQQELVQAGGGPSAALHYCYVSCCSRGGVAAVGGGSVVQINRTLFTHNDIGFHVDGARASVVVLRGSVFCNSAAAGLYAQACPRNSCLMEECVLFKNYMNVVCVEGAGPELRRCVLEAPVVFNAFISGVRTSPHFSACLLCPRANVVNAVTASSAKQRYKQGATTTTTAMGRGTNAARRASTYSQLGGNGTLGSQRVESLLRSVVDQFAVAVDLSMTATRGGRGSGGGGGRHPTHQTRQSTIATTPSPRGDAAAVQLEVGTEEMLRWLLVPSLWADHYAEPPTWQRLSDRDRAVEDAMEKLRTNRGKVREQLLLRRSAILWPSNVEETGVLGGPGGPFVVHRMRIRGDGVGGGGHGRGSYQAGHNPSFGAGDTDEEDGEGISLLQSHRVVDTQHRDGFLYSCSGLWLEHACTPQLESCYIGEHVSIGTGFDRPVALPEEFEWSLGVLPFLGEVRGGAAGQSVARLRANETLAPLTTPYMPPLTGTNTDTLLGQLLMVGSPCFWRRHAMSPLFFHENCSLLAEAAVDSVNQLVRKRQFEDYTTLSIHFGAAFTSHLVGTGVFARHYAEGDFQSCTLARNTAACRLSMGAKTCFKGCQLTANAAEAFVLEGRCLAAIQSCTFRDGRHTQIHVLGVETAPLIKHNTFIATPFTSIVVGERASPRITANQFTNVQSAAVVVETAAEPFLEKNQFDYCQCGIEYRSGATGRLERNHFKGSTLFAVLVKDRQTAPVVVGNTITDTRTSAVQVTGDGAQPYMEDNMLTANEIGIRLQAGAQGTYARNTLRKHRQGIVVEDSQGQFRGNHIAETQLDGFLASGLHCSPTVLSNRIQDGDSVGLRWDNAQGQIARNRLLHNAQEGCVIEGTSACPALVGNEIAQNGGVGLRIAKGSAPVLYCNAIASNAMGGVWVQDGDTNPVLEGDYIKANHNYGVLFDKKANGHMSACVVSATLAGPAVAIDDGARPVMQETAILNNTGGGVLVRSGARLQASRCLFAHNRSSRQSSAQGTAALVIMSSEDGTSLAGCAFLENDISVLAQRGAKAELTACGFLGAHSGSAAVRIHAEAAPLFAHCLFASTRCAVSEDGAGRYTRCQFMECAVGGEVSGASTFYECEFLECGTGLRIVAGPSTIMGCLFASCTKVGLHLTGDARPSVGECGVLRNVRGVLADGSASGTVSKSRILWNTDNVVINEQATTTVSGNLIYDGVNSGVLVRSGAPTISNNDIFDNHYAGVTVESASGGRLEENRVSFAREDGALVVKNDKESLSVAANTLRNSFSPPANSQFRNANERQLGYRKLATEKEKDSLTYAALRSFLDEICSTTVLRLTTLQSHTVAAASNKEWLVVDTEAAAHAPIASGDGGNGAASAITTGTNVSPASSDRKSKAALSEQDSPAGDGATLSLPGTTAAPASARTATADEPVSSFFEPFHTRWEKLSADTVASARCIAFHHLSAAAGTTRQSSASAARVSGSADSSPGASLVVVSPSRVGAGGFLPPISGSTTPAARRRSHVDATDEKAIASSSSHASSPMQQAGLSRPGTKEGEGTASGGGGGGRLGNVEREDLLPPAVTLVVLFHVKRALQKQLDQLQGTLNAVPAHTYTAVLHRPSLQTVSSVLDSDAFRAVFELHRALDVMRMQRAAKGSGASDRKGDSGPAASTKPVGSSVPSAPKKKRKSSVLANPAAVEAAALRLPSISINRAAPRGSAVSTGSGTSTSQQRLKKTRRKSGSSVLDGSTVGKVRKKKKKAAS